MKPFQKATVRMTVKIPTWNALGTNGRPPADTLVLLVGAEDGKKIPSVGDDVISNPRELDIDDIVGETTAS